MVDEFGIAFGNRLAEATKEMSPYEAARLLGISVVSYRNWCAGDVPFAFRALAKLVKLKPQVNLNNLLGVLSE
jgi:hypothetical protein